MPNLPVPANVGSGYGSSPAQAPTSPANFLMAAADLHSQGKLPSAPTPTGRDPLTRAGHGRPSRRPMKLVK